MFFFNLVVFFGLFNEVVSNFDFMLRNDRTNDELWIANDFKENDNDQLEKLSFHLSGGTE